MDLPPLSRTFFENNPSIQQNERFPYPEYRYTKYFWLINLQQAAYTRDQADYLVKLLRRAVLDVFTAGGAVAFAHKNHRWNRNYIGSNELQLAIEVGPKKGRVHAHLIQEVKHRSLINIDPADVKVRINQLLAEWTGGRVTNVFVTRKIHPSSKPLEEYIDKDNQPWKDEGRMVSGLFAYTLVSDPTTETWRAFNNTPSEITDTINVSMDVGQPQKSKRSKPAFTAVDVDPISKRPPGPSRPAYSGPISASSTAPDDIFGW